MNLQHREAQAAMFDMLRKANTALDAGGLARATSPGRREAAARGARKVRRDIGVLKDDDQPKMKVILDWPEPKVAKRHQR